MLLNTLLIKRKKFLSRFPQTQSTHLFSDESWFYSVLDILCCRYFHVNCTYELKMQLNKNLPTYRPYILGLVGDLPTVYFMRMLTTSSDLKNLPICSIFEVFIKLSTFSLSSTIWHDVMSSSSWEVWAAIRASPSVTRNSDKSSDIWMCL